jgi:hypothetical protein
MRSVPAIVMGEGFELFQRGKNWRGLCPLHDRGGRNPSFVAWESGWRCWSCGESGDGPAFIMKLKGLNYPEAMTYLGQEMRRPSTQERAQQANERKKKADTEWRERELARTIGIAIRFCHEFLSDISPETLDDHAIVLQQLPTLEYQHQILVEGSSADKAAVMADWQGVRLFQRTLLFKKGFDFRAWLSSVNKPPVEVSMEPTKNEQPRIKISFG